MATHPQTDGILAEPPVVTTVAGRVRGERVHGVARFLGIRYGRRVAGRSRFAPPQPPEPWTGVRDAVRYADSSPQPKERFSSPVTAAFRAPEDVVPGDDCLGLNVWAPVGATRATPVMVWLHGGGWVSGSGSSPVYDGANLARRGVVVVTLNHRLGASGLADFSRVLGGEFAGSSNLAIRDIIAALEWVRDNIAGFGGDPGLVAIFGESGGGWKVATLLGVPSAKGLFHRAIIQSGPLTRFLTPDQADRVAQDVLAELGVTREAADKLHELSWEQVAEAETRVMAKTPMSMQAPGFPAGFWPVIDGDLIPGHVFDPRAAASSLDVPLLVGQNGTEFTLFMLGDKAAYALDDAQLEQRVMHTFGPEAGLKILAAYRRDFPHDSPSGLWFRLYSDYAMGTLSVAILDARARAAGAAPVYGYRFEWRTPIMGGALLSPHTIEIPFVFDNTGTAAGVTMTGGGDAVAALAAQVSGTWVEFARTGRPAAQGLPAWPAYSAQGRESLHLNATSRVGPYMDPTMAALFQDKLWKAARLAWNPGRSIVTEPSHRRHPQPASHSPAAVRPRER